MQTKRLKNSEPFVLIEKRAELGPRQSVLVRLGSVLLALVAGGLFMLAIGYNPFELYGTIVYGAFRSAMAFQATVKIMIPLLIAALGVTLSFKMKFWNIGGEGQIIMGAVFASYFALYCANIPHVPLMIIMFVAGAIGGGLWGLIPAYFKAKFNTNETLLSLMLNYIAFNIIVLLRDGPWADPTSKGFPKIARFVENSQLDKVFGIQVGWIIGLALVVAVFFYMRYTKQGYEISVVGESKSTANYAGMNVKKIILRTMFISGAIAGIAGMVQASGSDLTLATAVAGGVGFTAIIVAWLARLNPIGILVVSFLFSVLEKGSSVMQSTYGISTYSANVIQGIILFFVLACEFFIFYKFTLGRKGGGKL
jgi:ABC-type uncharacterized transport system permease subunit